MSCPIGDIELAKLKMVIQVLDKNVELLNLSELNFMKEFIVKLGGRIPQTEPKIAAVISSAECLKVQDEVNENSDTIKEDAEAASELRSLAGEMCSAGNFEGAIEYFDRAILLNPSNALFYAKRGQCYLFLNQLDKCIADCTHALSLNCDSAAAFKFRGRANSLLGNLDDAVKDLRLACKIDYSEEADEWLKEVSQKAKERDQHRYEEERTTQNNSDNDGNTESNKFTQFDILNAFSDPEISAALRDISVNPSNIVKYQNNIKIMNLISKVGSTLGGMGAFGNDPSKRDPPAPSAGDSFGNSTFNDELLD